MIIKEIADRIWDTRISREQTMRRNRTGMLALGVAMGGTAGVIAGILLAPEAGKETRERLSRYSCGAWDTMKENAATTGHRLVNAVEEKSSQVRTAAEKGVEAAKESFQESSNDNKEGSV